MAQPSYASYLPLCPITILSFQRLRPQRPCLSRATWVPGQTSWLSKAGRKKASSGRVLSQNTKHTIYTQELNFMLENRYLGY